jgi:Na+-translocating ferredoxin:NAD+ oxidoreductase RnfC subunit
MNKILPLKKPVETNLHGEERSCIFCGFCENVCPVKVIPHLLYRYSKNEIYDESLLNYEIFKCMDCNLCTYVCPSKISVSAHIAKAKIELKKIKLDATTNQLTDPTILKGIQKEEVTAE